MYSMGKIIFRDKTHLGGPALDNDRQKALDTVIKNMEKSFGKGAVMKTW
ncbi:protein RecA [Staphylococcus gallinarum]|uniref:Protein RecA n=1 Tax=Staphylococcus gallinarum TaxID=1293 RepID=A0A380FH74_STAGA|nr:protein RecA [Staphylococcus gallinarum]